MTKWVKYTDGLIHDLSDVLDMPKDDANTLFEINPDPMTDPDNQQARIMVFGSGLADKVVELLNKENVDING